MNWAALGWKQMKLPGTGWLYEWIALYLSTVQRMQSSRTIWGVWQEDTLRRPLVVIMRYKAAHYVCAA